MPTGQADRLMPTLRRVVLARQSAARTDGELLGAFVHTRDSEAFAELVRRHGPMVLGVCRRVVRDHSTADDAFQAAFLVLARRAASVRPRERVGSWLYGVAYRTALKARTVRARRQAREKQVDAMPEPTAPPDLTAWTDLQVVIDEELAKLPDKLRLPVVLCDLEGRPQREVAKSLSVPPATLATRLASARRTLAARLTKRGVTLSGGALAGLLVVHASASAVPVALATGVVRAVEAGGGTAVGVGLVSAQAVQLSEGVMRMMMLAKLKATAVIAAVALALTTSLGVGLAPASAGDQPGAAAPAPNAKPRSEVERGQHTALKPATPPANEAQAEPEADDAKFLRQLSLDVRKTLPTDVETWLFVSDDDAEKRAKVIEWIVDDEDVRVLLAKKLGVPVERVRGVRAKLSADGKFVELVLEEGAAPKFVDPLAYSPDGKRLALRTAQENKLAVVKDKDGKAPAERRVVVDRDVIQLFDSTDKADGTLRLWAPPKPGFFRVWDMPEGKTQISEVYVEGNDGKDGPQRTFKYVTILSDGGGDAEFLKRVLTDVRGSAPTALELKYFTEDKDPRKREKLIELLLKEPAVQKKLGDEWKKKMLSFQSANLPQRRELFYYVVPNEKKDVKELRLEVQPFVVPLPPTPGVPGVPPVPPAPPKPPLPGVAPKAVPPTPAFEVKPDQRPVPAPPAQADKLEKLVAELIAAKKSDEAILEALTLATLSRLPTDAEKRLTLAAASGTSDRKAAWIAVARALARSEVKPDVLIPRVVEPKPPARP